MALDEDLLARNNQDGNDDSSSETSEDSVGRFNSGKSAAAKKASSEAVSGLTKAIPGPAGLAARIALKKAQKELEKSADTTTAGAGNPATSSLLKAAWQNLIPTFGLSVIWIDIHIFLSKVLGKDLFCSLGQEWFPKGTPLNIDGAKKSVGMTEGMAVGCLNLGCLFLIIAVLSIVAMIVTGIENPFIFIKGILGSIWRAMFGGEK